MTTVPETATLDFAGYLARAVPGKTWLELKTSINDNSVPFPEDFRWRCVRDLVLALSVLEQEGIVHGDLSPNNIVVDLDARPDQPALYLIDFDAFVAPAAGGNAMPSRSPREALTAPRAIARRTWPPAVADGDGSVGALFGPLWTRHAADGTALHGPRPVARRSSVKLELRVSETPLHGMAGSRQSWTFADPVPFGPGRSCSPWRKTIGRASAELAAGSGFVAAGEATPPANDTGVEFHAGRAWPPPAVRAHRTAIGDLSRSRELPGTLRFMVPWRWSRPASSPGYTTLWQDLKVGIGCALVLALPGILALGILLVKATCEFFGVPLHR